MNEICKYRSFCLDGVWKTWSEMTVAEREKKKQAKILMFQASKKPWGGEDEEFWKNVEISVGSVEV